MEIESLSSGYTEPPKPVDTTPSSRLGPPIPGLYFDPSVLLPDELAESLLQKCMETYFYEENVNQVMLFERVMTRDDASLGSSASTGLPPFLRDLLSTLSAHLHPLLPRDTHKLLFPPAGSPPRARQAIVNFYRPGEGIAPHVDLLERFGDGIVGVSLGSGCVMRFAPAGGAAGPQHTVFLPHGSVYVMSGEARYGWAHGIEGRREDWVQACVGAAEGRWVMRAIRVSVTFRWLLPGADVVGGLPDADAKY
ncbi:hypothetical protein PHLGIDRAFT_65776 [Phlebiopsis gigantea 11061_1 CR5-6]|uniref:Fe2OG dioxygenase domain-containing protein n=1 Tax=Phlebiopsis gigantea (strain 11061_1 CR5-6) TaxID=745531 RepID=A0A0C3SBW2_PHLG1|nr:hypothetical protein PHLGIDRAFT_65776 [Phlebiopsis gigantea 11061_1 CR5-6]